MSKKIDKPLFRLTKKNRKRHELAKSGMREASLLTLQKMNIREYYEKLYATELDNLGKIDQFTERHKLTKLIQEGTKKSDL